MSTPTVVEVRAFGSVSRSLTDAVIEQLIDLADETLDAKVAALLDRDVVVSLTSDQRHQLVLWLAAHECSRRERLLLSEAGAGLSASYSEGDRGRFKAGFNSLWQSIVGAQGGAYAVNKGWL